ncbi:hypothetical protein COCSUDRAFT_45003 [Coccomyxa subellipsoidea C-169]|uniref:FHA domain-containing protein n=1 Tax=Coccomyxa subellipsoidea (strain C-169) TaxID=574566 RepID=I0YKC1_COCSC|nr:hypothetical protein COCSUDRAFT_45003 [Coccomyxa subellipsoidea C-169]EIE18840.1 hypothetical protein COCSUDRAFT_45003 [Coccomyxa subellipsoidea C-169]|eukprot:XP_005643384.1 hypothetical protein COCSUDRAFT_45003 [Coccomyxa subellipsoidea C-169]
MVVSPNDPRIDQVGFAKLLGDGFELCAKKYEIVIGRHSKSSTVDVVLGDNMNISRQHAKILYNFSRGVWELHVLGKNGVTVEGTLHTPSSPPVVLRSQDLIQIADRSLYFLLPRQQQQWASPQKADPPAARSATPAASSLVPAQQHAALPPGAGSAHSVVQQLAASLPLSQQQAMVAQGQPHTGPPAHGTANQTHAPEQPYSASQAAQNLVPQDQAQAMETDGS